MSTLGAIIIVLLEIQEVKKIKNNLHLKILWLEKRCISKENVIGKLREINKEIEFTLYNSKLPITEELIEKGTGLIAQKDILMELLRGESI